MQEILGFHVHYGSPQCLISWAWTVTLPDSEVNFPKYCASACLLYWWDCALAGLSVTDVHSWAVSTVKVGCYPSHASWTQHASQGNPSHSQPQSGWL